MKIIRNIVNYFGFDSHRVILKKTIGSPLNYNKKSAVNEIFINLLWASMVLGDYLFPSLTGKRVLGKVHASGLIVLLTASSIPIMLTYRMWCKFVNHEFTITKQSNQTTSQQQPFGGTDGR